MNFTSTVMPGVRAFANATRAKRCHAQAAMARATLSSPPSRMQHHLRAHWRVCPLSGQLQQRWGLDESQEPPNRCFAHLLQQIGLVLGLNFGVRTFS